MWRRLAAFWGHRGRSALPAAGAAEDWYTAESLAGFPLEVVRPHLARYSLGRLHTAWVLAVRGHEPSWIAVHLDLPESLVAQLVVAVGSAQRGG